MRKFITMALLLTGMILMLPVQSQALVRQPAFDSLHEYAQPEPVNLAEETFSPIFPEIPEYVVLIVEVDGLLYGIICGNDPVNNVDPLGLAIVVIGAGEDTVDPEKGRTKELTDLYNLRLKGGAGPIQEQKYKSGKHYRWYQNVMVNKNPELYRKYHRVSKKVTGDKAQVFTAMREALESVKDDPENHLVFMLHGLSYVGQRHAHALQYDDVTITFDEMEAFLKSIRGKYNISTFTLSGCNVPESAASRFKAALGADVYYSDVIAGSSFIDYGAALKQVEKITDWDTDYKGEPLFRYTYQYETTPYLPTTHTWKLPVKDPETGEVVIDPETGEKKYTIHTFKKAP